MPDSELRSDLQKGSRRAGKTEASELGSQDKSSEPAGAARKSLDNRSRPSFFPNRFAWAALFLSPFIAYFPALRGGLLWDDSGHITRLELQSLEGLWRIWFDLGATQQYYPLLHSAFWLEHRIWGDAILGYHITGVALHGLAACLVVLIVRRMQAPGAWLAGFVFALHPVCVEAVAWISEQKSTLSAVFYLAAALTYLSFDQTRRKSRYWLASGLFALALLSKTVTATLPAALLVVLWWQRGGLDWRRDVRPLLPWFAVGAGAGLFTAWIERSLIGATGQEFALTVTQRILLASRVIWFYASKLVWPVNLIFTYPRWTIDSSVWWQYLFLAGVAFMAASLLVLARRHRGPLAGFLFFAGTLFPVLGFLNVYPFRYSYVADHFQYLASLGIIVPAASGLTILSGRLSISIKGARAFASALVLILGSLSWRQSGSYRDIETLYREVLARNPGSWMAHYNLGIALSENPGRLPEAIAEFEAALRIKARFAEAHNNLGDALSRIPGRMPDAIAQYEAALRIQPNYAKAHYNLGNALAKLPGRLLDAMAEFRAALRSKADYAEAHNNLGNALRQMGLANEAAAEYRAALGIRPDYAEAHDNLGTVLFDTPGRLPDAIAEYQAALRIRPDYGEAHVHLGGALARIPGRLPDAIAELKAALRIQPSSAQAHDLLGNALEDMPGRLSDAIAEYEAALRADPKDASAHYNLAGALSQMPGRLTDAIAEYRAALKGQPDFAEAHNNLGSIFSQIPGRLSEAIAEYQSALRIRPNYAKAHYNLGNALAQMPGRLTDAAAEYRAALRIQPDDAGAHTNLASVLSRMPDHRRDAMAECEAALQINPDLKPARQLLQRLQSSETTAK